MCVSLLLLKKKGEEQQPSFFLIKGSKAKEEIDSWIPFVESLETEVRQLFNDMVKEASSLNCFDLIEELPKGDDDECTTTEAFLLCLLILNQKTMNSISNQIFLIRKKTA
jgi:hypothetical protein